MSNDVERLAAMLRKLRDEHTTCEAWARALLRDGITLPTPPRATPLEGEKAYTASDMDAYRDGLNSIHAEERDRLATALAAAQAEAEELRVRLAALTARDHAYNSSEGLRPSATQRRWVPESVGVAVMCFSDEAVRYGASLEIGDGSGHEAGDFLRAATRDLYDTLEREFADREARAEAMREAAAKVCENRAETLVHGHGVAGAEQLTDAEFERKMRDAGLGCATCARIEEALALGEAIRAIPAQETCVDCGKAISLTDGVWGAGSQPRCATHSGKYATPCEHPTVVQATNSAGTFWRCGYCGARVPNPRLPATPAAETEPTYPCVECGAPRTKAEGGTTFTVCDACWDKGKTHAPGPSADTPNAQEKETR